MYIFLHLADQVLHCNVLRKYCNGLLNGFKIDKQSNCAFGDTDADISVGPKATSIFCKRGKIRWAKLLQFSRVPRKFLREYLLKASYNDVV